MKTKLFFLKKNMMKDFFLFWLCMVVLIPAQAIDDVYLIAVNSIDLDRYWIHTRSPKPVFTNQKDTKGGCVAIGFIIGSDGKTHNHRIVASFPDDALETGWLDAFKKMSYSPADENSNRTPVTNLHTFAF